jgi:predicted kinase
VDSPAALFVVVSGPPASGKSTIAPPLAAALSLPLVAKDVIKDALITVLGAEDVGVSRRLGTAAVAAMLAVARSSVVGAVLESNFYRSRAREPLSQLPGPVVEVFCRCDREVAYERYRRRAADERRRGYFDDIRTRAEIWDDEVARPVDGGWPVLYVDTEGPVDTAALAARARRAASAGERWGTSS